MDAAVAAAEARLGPVAALINNAGWDVAKQFVEYRLAVTAAEKP